ncbi:MAG: GxxExxY protein [Oscillospiraceae bacterium]|nr:GxxExxY protein [Oscillospiraceae bacterium]
MIEDLKHNELTESIIEAFYDVYNCLGYGYLENVYQNALYFELKDMGYKVEAQKVIEVFYRERVVGKYFADLIVEDCVILELKAASMLAVEHECQLINYLKSTDIEVGLLLNFGKKPQFKRKVFENENKQNIEK